MGTSKYVNTKKGENSFKSIELDGQYTFCFGDGILS